MRKYAAAHFLLSLLRNTTFSTNKWYKYDKDQVWFWKPEELGGASLPAPKSLR